MTVEPALQLEFVTVQAVDTLKDQYPPTTFNLAGAPSVAPFQISLLGPSPKRPTTDPHLAQDCIQLDSLLHASSVHSTNGDLDYSLNGEKAFIRFTSLMTERLDEASSASVDGEPATKFRRPSQSTGVERSSPPKKVDVSHFPHYGLKRGMACTFCRKRKLKCSGERPQCSNCIKYTKVCEYGPPVKVPKAPLKNRTSPSTAPMGAGYLAQAGAGMSLPLTPGEQYMFHHGVAQLYQAPAAAYHNQMDVGGALPMSSPDAHQVNLSSGMPQMSYFPNHSQYFPQGQQASMAGVSPQQPGLLQYPSFYPSQPTELQVGGQWGNQSVLPMSSTPSSQIATFPGQDATVVQQDLSSTSGTSSSNNLVASASSHLPSSHSTPDGLIGAPTSSSSSTGPSTNPPVSAVPILLPEHSNAHYGPEGPAVEGLTERLGDFLFSPNRTNVDSRLEEDEGNQRRTYYLVPDARGITGASAHHTPSIRSSPGRASPGVSLPSDHPEYDGLEDHQRELLLDCFLVHTTLFFEMSTTRFRERMVFTDRRRPSLALLNTMYLWATRISSNSTTSNLERQFFEAACKHLDVANATSDRPLDAVRAAILLSVYCYSSERHHEGWYYAGIATRLVQSCGLHRIASSVFQPEAQKSPFLRSHTFCLSPPEDALEHGERIHAFWAAFAVDRCGALATGYSSSLRDEDICTPFARSLIDIANGNVNQQDDSTVRDLYRRTVHGSQLDTPYTRWIKCIAILERASQLWFNGPDAGSPYEQAWTQYRLNVQRDPSTPLPPGHLDQPKYRVPAHYTECLIAIEQLVTSLGEDGVSPVDRLMQNQGSDPLRKVDIQSSVVTLHHLINAVHMVLHDINNLEADNTEALKPVRKCILLLRAFPQTGFTDVDASVVVVWTMIGKVLVKEVQRLASAGEMDNAQIVALEVDAIIEELRRIGTTTNLGVNQGRVIEDLKLAAFNGVERSRRGPVGEPDMSNMLMLRRDFSRN